MHFILYFLAFQHDIKLYHWTTLSYSRHKASDKLFSDLSDNIDKFVEIYIGIYGRPKFSKKELTNNYHIHNDKDIISCLDEFNNYLKTTIFNFISKDNTDLLKIRDSIIGDINQTKYLFTLE